MSNFNRTTWAIFPLLSILSMSPAQLETKQASRWLASVTETKQETSKHPRFDKLVTKVEKSVTKHETTEHKFLEKTGLINEKLKKERESFKKNLDKKDEVAKQRKEIESIVAEIVVHEEDLKILKDKKLLKEKDQASSEKDLALFKDLTEGLLTDLDVNEGLVAELEKPKTEEPKKEEPLPQLPAVVVEEPKKTEEPKKDTPAVVVEEPKKDKECKEDKVKVLTEPAEKLVVDQNLILQQMMQMNSMMMLMMQQMQISQMHQMLPNQGPVNQQAYQYVAPNQGGWAYRPNGGQQPGFYPDQLQQQPQPQGYNGWGMRPEHYFQDPRMTPMPLNPGQFGGPTFGFNMTPNIGPQAPMGPMMGPQNFQI